MSSRGEGGGGPMAIASAESRFNIAFHENDGEREIRDLVEAVTKVAAAYRR